jgi:hypothetical protein
MPDPVVTHRYATSTQLQQQRIQSDVRLLLQPRQHSAWLASINGRLPPIGRAAGLPTSFIRRVQRIAVETLTSNRVAAARQLTPEATAETTRSRKSREYGAPIHAGLLVIPASSFNPIGPRVGKSQASQPQATML